MFTALLGLLAAFVVTGGAVGVCVLMIRSVVRDWRNTPARGSSYNPLLEMVQPQARHTVEARQQGLREDEGSAPS